MNYFINFMANGAVNSQVQGASQTSNGGGGFSSMLIIFAVFFVILYFFSIRPNKKREKEKKEKLAAIKKGDRVQTIGGWRGNVVAIKDTTFTLKLEDGAKIEIIKGAISDVIISTNSSPSHEQPQTEEKIENTPIEIGSQESKN